jgi:hypothetical protein
VSKAEENKAPVQLKGSNGKFLTESLFWETSRDRNTYKPHFTLKPLAHKGYPSLKLLYLQYQDPTEYTFAIGVFGSWQHWELLTSLDWFKPHIEEWRKELTVLLQSSAARAALDVLSDADAPAATKMQAARYIADQGWKPKAQKGRPKKAEVQKEARAMAETKSRVDSDFKRLFN